MAAAVAVLLTPAWAGAQSADPGLIQPSATTGQTAATTGTTAPAGTAPAGATPAATGATAGTKTGTAATGQSAVDLISVPVIPIQTLQLPAQQPVATSFQLGQVEGIKPELVEGVTAKGYARKVDVEDKSVGQILVTTVAKDDREEVISAEGLTAQFDAKEKSKLFPQTTFDVEGSKSALIAALERLQKKKDKEEKKEEKTSNTDSDYKSSSGASSNNEASRYQTPTVTKTTSSTASTAATDTVDVTSSTDGCSIRVDIAQGKAFQQSKELTYTNGQLTGTSECTDSESSYVLQKSYLSCPTDVVDLATLTAWPQYQWYYIDENGENQKYGSCVTDTDNPYTIVEDGSTCTMLLDFEAGTATPQTALVYTNRSGAKIEARGCQKSGTASSIAMTESTASCPMRHDFTAGKSYELSMWTYQLNGVTYQAAACADNGTTFVHQKVFTSNGAYVCPVITNMTTKTATLQYKVAITVDGVSQYISDCTPDTTSKSIVSTTDGCMDPSKWTHDLDADVSYGQERFYYIGADGSSRVYVTDCQTSSVSYQHDQTITGYEYHDANLWAYPLITVTITVNGSPYTIVSNQVMAGSPQLAYVLARTEDVANGQSSYDGCSAYRLTNRSTIYTRPDGTEYAKAVGTGTPVGPVNVCTSYVAATKNLNLWNSATFLSSTENPTHTCITGYSLVNKTEYKNTETGVVISQSCYEVSQSSTSSPCDTAAVSGGWNGQGTLYGIFGSNIIQITPVNTATGGAWTGYSNAYGTSCPAGF